MILNNGRLKVYEIVKAINRYVLHEELRMRKIFARWASYLLNAKQKPARCLPLCYRNKTSILAVHLPERSLVVGFFLGKRKELF